MRSYIQDLQKTYFATLRLGVESDTYDIFGTLCPFNDPVVSVTADDIDRLFKELEGSYLQTAPMYSAKKIKGQRFYRLARKGIIPPERKTTVQIYRLELSAFRYPVIQFVVTCSKGTYVRYLAQDIAKQLGSRGVLTDLQRHAVGWFTIAESIRLKFLDRTGHSQDLNRFVYPLEIGLRGLPSVKLSGRNIDRFRNGITLMEDQYIINEPLSCVEGIVAVYSDLREVIGIGTLIRVAAEREFTLKPVKLLGIKI